MTKLLSDSEYESDDESNILHIKQDINNDKISGIDNNNDNDNDNDNDNESNVLQIEEYNDNNEINNIENETNLIDLNINDLEDLSNKIKEKIDIESSDNNFKEKLLMQKNKIDNELLLLNIYNLKYKKYLNILKQKHKLELEYIEEMFIYESKKERLNDKYNCINVNKFKPLNKNYLNDLNEQELSINSKQHTDKESNQTQNIQESVNKESIINKSHKQVNIQNENKSIEEKSSVKRRHTISEPSLKINKNDHRNDGSLQFHLQDALQNKFKSLNLQKNDEDSIEDNEFK